MIMVLIEWFFVILLFTSFVSLGKLLFSKNKCKGIGKKIGLILLTIINFILFFILFCHADQGQWLWSTSTSQNASTKFTSDREKVHYESFDPQKVAKVIYNALNEMSEKDIKKEFIEKINNASIKFTSKIDGFAITFPSTPRRLVIDNYSDFTVVNYQSLSNDEFVQYNVSLNIFKYQKILSDESQKAFLENHLAGRLVIAEEAKVIENRLGVFKGFNSNFYKYSHHHEGIEIISEGVVFLVDGDSISLTCVYPKSISPVHNLNDFKTSFELVPLEPVLQKTSWTNRRLDIKIPPQIDMLVRKPSNASTVVSFANKGGHSLIIMDVNSADPSFKMSDVSKELGSADFEPDGFIINTIYNNKLGMKFIQMLKFIEHNDRIYMLQSYSPEISFIRYKETFKASINTFSSI